MSASPLEAGAIADPGRDLRVDRANLLRASTSLSERDEWHEGSARVWRQAAHDGRDV